MLVQISSTDGPSENQDTRRDMKHSPHFGQIFLQAHSRMSMPERMIMGRWTGQLRTYLPQACALTPQTNSKGDNRSRARTAISLQTFRPLRNLSCAKPDRARIVERRAARHNLRGLTTAPMSIVRARLSDDQRFLRVHRHGLQRNVGMVALVLARAGAVLVRTTGEWNVGFRQAACRRSPGVPCIAPNLISRGKGGSGRPRRRAYPERAPALTFDKSQTAAIRRSTLRIQT
jgi:hypothetical protein